MNRVIQLALLQTVLFISVVFFFYVTAYGVRAVLSDGSAGVSAITHLFSLASLLAMASTVQVLLRSGRPLYSRLAIGSSLVAAAAVFVQGVAPILALVPAANAIAILGFVRQRQRV